LEKFNIASEYGQPLALEGARALKMPIGLANTRCTPTEAMAGLPSP
jgi:hypothetical protein